MFMKIFPGVTSGQSPSTDSLSEGLISWWTLDETTGTRVDSHGSNNLSGGSAGYIAGKQSNAADFNGTSQHLYVTTPTGIPSGANDWAVAFWIYLDELTTAIMDALCGLGDATISANSADAWHVGYRNGTEDAFDITIRVSSTRYHVNASTFGTPNINTWYFLYAQHDSVADQVGISINAGTLDTAGYSGTPNTKTGAFTVGRWGSAGSYPYWLNGKIDELAVWNRVLTSTEVETLYNSGSGLSYNDL